MSILKNHTPCAGEMCIRIGFIAVETQDMHIMRVHLIFEEAVWMIQNLRFSP
jgi:hypothetical protein